MQTSPSSLKLFGDCARQYFYKKILHLEGDEVGSLTTLGSVWHYAVDVYENFDHDIDLAKRTFVYYWDNFDELGLRIDFWHRSTNHNGLKTRGLTMLDRYHELSPWQTGRLVGTEVEFHVPIGEHVLHGYIDKLWARPGQKILEVVDFKTGSYVPAKLAYNVQFTSYCYATMRPEFWANVPGFEDGHLKFAGWKRNGWWYHARNHKMINAGTRTDLDYRRLSLAVQSQNLAIEREVFPLDYSGESCGWCAWVEICGTEVESPLADVDLSETQGSMFGKDEG